MNIISFVWFRLTFALKDPLNLPIGPQRLVNSLEIKTFNKTLHENVYKNKDGTVFNIKTYLE